MIIQSCSLQNITIIIFEIGISIFIMQIAVIRDISFLFKLSLYTSMAFNILEKIMEIKLLYIYVKNFGREFENMNEYINWLYSLRTYRIMNLLSYIKAFFFVISTIISIFEITLLVNFEIFAFCYIYIILLYHIILSLMFIFYYVKNKKKINVVLTNITCQGNDECIICLDNNEKKWVAMKCSHKFHEDCINQWLIQSNTCPICRSYNLFFLAKV